MFTPAHSPKLFGATALLFVLSAACTTQRIQMNEAVLTRDSAVEFLNRFEEIAEKENFDLIEEMIHANAVFRFNDGDFIGRPAVRGAARVRPTPTTGKVPWRGGRFAFKPGEPGSSLSRTAGCRSSMST